MLFSIVLLHVVDRLEVLVEATEDQGPHQLVLFFVEHLRELISVVLVEGIVVYDDALLHKELEVDLLTKDDHDSLQAFSIVKAVIMGAHDLFEWGLYDQITATVG